MRPRLLSTLRTLQQAHSPAPTGRIAWCASAEKSMRTRPTSTRPHQALLAAAAGQPPVPRVTPRAGAAHRRAPPTILQGTPHLPYLPAAYRRPRLLPFSARVDTATRSRPPTALHCTTSAPMPASPPPWAAGQKRLVLSGRATAAQLALAAHASTWPPPYQRVDTYRTEHMRRRMHTTPPHRDALRHRTRALQDTAPYEQCAGSMSHVSCPMSML